MILNVVDDIEEQDTKSEDSEAAQCEAYDPSLFEAEIISKKVECWKNFRKIFH